MPHCLALAWGPLPPPHPAPTPCRIPLHLHVAAPLRNELLSPPARLSFACSVSGFPNLTQVCVTGEEQSPLGPKSEPSWVPCHRAAMDSTAGLEKQPPDTRGG